MKLVVTAILGASLIGCSGVDLNGDAQKSKSDKKSATATQTSSEEPVGSMLTEDGSVDSADRANTIASKLLEKFDASQNSELDQSELVQLVSQVKQRMRAKKGRRGPHGKRGPRQYGQRPKPNFDILITCLDANSDQLLSKEEFESKTREEKRECFKANDVAVTE